MSTYLGLEAQLHDAFWEEEGNAAELPLMVEFLAAHPGRALEIGCGSGRLLLPLLAAGFEIEGLDNSPDMLALCRESAERQGLAARLHAGDMAVFAPPRRFASLLLPAFTFQFAQDPVAVLRHFAGILDPGGALYLTVFRPLAELAGELPENEWFADHRTTLPDGRLAALESRHSIDRGARILDRQHRYAVFADATAPTPLSTRISSHRLHWFDPGELESLLETAGFSVTRRIAEFDDEEPVDEETQILTVFAKARL